MKPRTTTSLLVFLAVAALAACTRRPTEIMLRVDSDLDDQLQSVRVQVDRGSGTSRFWDLSYSLHSGTFHLPGTLAIAPRSAADTTPINVRVIAEFADPAQNFDQHATVTFAEGRTLLLEMYLASACRDPTVRARCESQGQTCTAGGQCIAVTRPPLPDFNADVVLAPVDGTDAQFDGFDGASDAADSPDEPLDVAADGAVDGAGDASDVQADVPADLSCSGAMTNCSGTCTDLSRDSANCGSCGHTCGWSCTAGACDDAAAINGGASTSCACRTSGGAVCWGWNFYGQIGDGTSGAGADRLTPASVSGLTDAVEIAAGGGHACARRRLGSVVCWGLGHLLGDGITTHASCGSSDCSATPVAVSGLVDAVQIAAGYMHTCARRASGGVVCWGDNGHGELGDGTTMQHLAPVTVSGLSDAVDIAAGGTGRTCAVRTSGAVVCWGDNASGGLGDGTTTQRLTPVAVTGLTDAVEVSAGFDHTCARRATGAVVCWGDNVHGQIGDGTTTQRLAPAAVVGLSDAVEIAVGGYHACARRGAGSVTCWGHNGDGQIGDGTSGTNRLAPVASAGVTGVVQVAAGLYHTCARRASGDVVCWGQNGQGQIGDGTSGTARLTPVAVVPP